MYRGILVTEYSPAADRLRRRTRDPFVTDSKCLNGLTASYLTDDCQVSTVLVVAGYGQPDIEFVTLFSAAAKTPNPFV